MASPVPEKQLIVAIEGTAALGPYWPAVLSDYLEKIVRNFYGNDSTGQKASASGVELSLIIFHTPGSYSPGLVLRSGWTRNPEVFLEWLSAMQFGGGGFSEAAIAEGLAEALMMFSRKGNVAQQNVDGQRHCILVVASNPHPLPTPGFWPQLQSDEQNDSVETQTESRLSDAESVAKSFGQCGVSLSVICPKQLPKLKAIYNAGKRNPRVADLPVDDTKNPHFLVLISKIFKEARAALSRPGITNLSSNQSPVKVDATSFNSVSGPPSVSIPSGSVIIRQPVSVGTIPSATVKIEPTTVGPIGGPTFPHIPSVPRVASQIPSLQQTSSTMQKAQSNYVKVWEGNLSGKRQGQPVFITILEGYKRASASETLAANWPATMQIVRLISQDNMNNKEYVGKEDILVFRAMTQHGFLGQLQEKKLCAVIQLPSQTLLLSVSDKAHRLIGMLFPGDMIVFKPQVPYQQQQEQLQQQQHQQLQQQPLGQMQQQPLMPMQQQQQQMSQLQPQQQIPQMQQQQHQLQMVGTGMGQTYIQGPGRSQLMSQGKVSSQGPPTLSGGDFLN